MSNLTIEERRCPPKRSWSVDVLRVSLRDLFGKIEVRDENPVEVLTGENKLIRLNQIKTWDGFYKTLSAYKKQHGDCEVPLRYTEDRRLGAWVESQRRDREKLSSGQRKQLDDLGFDWRTRQERVEFDLI
jgi:hypothetical protein